MAFYRRGFYRRGYRRNYGRYYRRSRWPYRSMRGTLVRSQTSGVRRLNISIPVQEAFSVSITTPAGGSGVFWSDVYAIQPFLQVISGTGLANVGHGNLISSRLYRVYTTLYDQMKINSCYIKMTVMTNIGSGGVTPALRVVTMWDRNMCVEDLYGSGMPSTDQLEVGSGSQVTMIVNNSRAIMTRYLKASDIQEWTKFHDCSLVTSGNYKYDGSWCVRKAATENFANGQDCGFVPGMYFALNSATAPAAGASFVFSLQFEIRWNVTFRNPKFGLSAGGVGAKGIGVEVPDEKKVVDVKEGGDVKGDVGMDDDTEIVVHPEDIGDVGDDEKEVKMDLSDEEIAAILAKLKEKT